MLELEIGKIGTRNWKDFNQKLKIGKPPHLVLPGPVVLAVLLLLFLLVLERSLPGPKVEVALPEVPHGELEQRVLAVVGDLGRADADVGHVARIVGAPVPDVIKLLNYNGFADFRTAGSKGT